MTGSGERSLGCSTPHAWANRSARAWTRSAVTETAAHLGFERGALSRLLNGNAGVSVNMALALEDLGWGTADHWMRMQASHELAQARKERFAPMPGASQ